MTTTNTHPVFQPEGALLEVICRAIAKVEGDDESLHPEGDRRTKWLSVMHFKEIGERMMTAWEDGVGGLR